MSFIELKYSSWIENWRKEKDDRRIAYNLYKQILEAKKVHDGLKNAFYRLAISKAIREQEEEIDKIIYRFSGLKWKDGKWKKG